MWGLAPLLRHVGDDMGFAMLVTWACGALYLACLASDPEGIRNTGLLSFLSPSFESLLRFGASGAGPVLGYGHWWTLLSAGWLHGSVLHILFNMLWVRDLAPPTARLYGPGRTVIVYTVAGVCGFAASSLAGVVPFLPPFLRGAGFTVGASAPIFGLIGALLHYGRRGGSSHIGQQAKSLAITMLLFGFIMPRCRQLGAPRRPRRRLPRGEAPRPAAARAGQPHARRARVPAAVARLGRPLRVDRDPGSGLAGAWSRLLPERAPNGLFAG